MSNQEMQAEELSKLFESAEFYLKTSGLLHLPNKQEANSMTEQLEPLAENLEPVETTKVIPFSSNELPLQVEISNVRLPNGKSCSDLSYADLSDLVHACTLCRLHETRKNVVFGAGRVDRPLIAFVGEGPGADEDLSGEPFVGKAGQLLNAAITKGLKLRREDVYLCNAIKCLPPENRSPLVDEIESCRPYLFRQLELVQPKVIVILGSPAQKALIGRPEGISKLRGRWLEWRGVKVMPTFHPAYILRTPEAKKEFWSDLKLVMEELGLPVE